MTRRRRALAAGCILAAGLGAAACGSQDINLRPNEKPNVQRGAVLFAQRCSGCHTFAVAGTQGGATKIHDRERTDGPNFNVRKENKDDILFAIQDFESGVAAVRLASRPLLSGSRPQADGRADPDKRERQRPN